MSSMLASSLKKRKRVFRHSVLNSKRKNAKLPQLLVKEDAPRRERKPRPTTPRRKEGAERKPRSQKPVEKAPKTVKAPREEQHTPVSDISALTVGQALKVKAGQNAMDATVLEITKDGVRVQLNSGMSLIVRAEHLVF